METLFPPTYLATLPPVDGCLKTSMCSGLKTSSAEPTSGSALKLVGHAMGRDFSSFLKRCQDRGLQYRPRDAPAPRKPTELTSARHPSCCRSHPGRTGPSAVS